MRFLHHPSGIRPHGLPEPDIFREGLRIFLAEAPDLISRSRGIEPLARLIVKRRCGNPVPVQAHHRAEAAPLKPAHQQLAEGRIVRIAAGKASDVRGPPGNPRDPHIQSGADLSAKRLPVGMDVSAPDQSAVALAARPGAAQQAYHTVLSRRLQALIKGSGVGLGIDISHLSRRPLEIAVIVKIISGKLRLRLVQPEDPDALVIIILSALVPDVFPGAGIGGVEEGAVSVVEHGHIHALVRLHQKALLLHLLIVLAAKIHLRPYGNHQLHAHFLQFLRHGLRIREKLLVEAVIAHSGPVEKVADDHVHRDASSLILPRHVQKLLLIPVAQLALPEAKAVLRHLGSGSHRPSIGLLDLVRRIPRRDPVIHLLRAFRIPFRGVGSEAHPADGRIVPQETVSQVGKHEGHAGLGIAVRQLQIAVFHIQDILLILPHAVQLLLRVGGKGHRQPVVPADDGLEKAVLLIQSASPSRLLQQKLPLLIVEGDIAGMAPGIHGKLRRDLPVCDAGNILSHLDLSFCLFRGKQGIIRILHLSQHGGTHAEAVPPPGHHGKHLSVPAVD